MPSKEFDQLLQMMRDQPKSKGLSIAERRRLVEKDGVKVILETWEKMFHVRHFFAKILPEGRKAVDGIGKFIRQQISKAGESNEQTL